MADVIQETQHEFWRPPSPAASDDFIVHDSTPTMAEACSRCGTEFLLGSRFCHTCGARRPEAMSASARADAAAIAGLWEHAVGRVVSLLKGLGRLGIPAWMRQLQFQKVRSYLGLGTGALVAFLIGIGCVFGALVVGLLNVKTLADWQAIQFYRVEWLLGATASFVAGILLKNSGTDSQ